MTPKRAQALDSIRAMAAVFSATAPEPQDSQICEFGFASHTFAVDSERRFELSLDAEPSYSPAHGLGWRMRLSGHLCLDDSCETLFEAELPPELAQRLALSKRPLADACEARPELFARATKRFPGLGQALGAAALAINERRALKASIAPGARKARKPGL